MSLVLACILILQIATLATIPAEAQTDMSGTFGERITEYLGDIVFKSSGDGTFSVKILDDGRVQGQGKIQRTVTISGPCNVQWSDSGTVDISGSADLTSKNIRLAFNAYEPPPTPYQCGSVQGYVASPTYRFSNLQVNLALQNGARFEDTRNQPCGPSDTCIIWIEIKQIGGINGGKPAPAGSFDFSLGIDPDDLCVPRGGTTETTISVYLDKGTPQSVTLNVETEHRELLGKIKVKFSKQSGSPTFTSDLTILALPDAPVGTFTIYIVGEGGGVTRYRTLTLAIECESEQPPKPYPEPTGECDFTLSVLPTSVIEVTEGESASWTIKINWRTSPSRIHLTSEFEPQLMPWHKVTLEPREIKEVREGTSTLTIKTNPNPTKGFVKEVEEYKITITAKCVYSGGTRSATLNLVVKQKPTPAPIPAEEKCPSFILTPKLPPAYSPSERVQPGERASYRFTMEWGGEIPPTGLPISYTYVSDRNLKLLGIDISFGPRQSLHSNEASELMFAQTSKDTPENKVAGYTITIVATVMIPDPVTKKPQPCPARTTVFLKVDKEAILHEDLPVLHAVIKHKEKMSLLSIRNIGDVDIASIQLKMDDGKIMFVKVRGWDRERIDQSTILLLGDRPLEPRKSSLILLKVDNPSSSFEWTAFDIFGQVLGRGQVIESK